MADDGKVVFSYEGDTSGIDRANNEAESKMSGLGSRLGSAAGKIFLAVGTAAVAAGGAVLSLGAEFEATMSGVEAVSGATQEEMSALRDAALQAGQDTIFSASESASAIEELLKAGLTIEQVLGGGLSGALDLASAGELALGSAAEIASTVLNAFRDDNLSVADAANILAGAANASATDVEGMALGLSQSAAVAAGMGMSFEDTATALALFAQNGLKGSDAGTSLKTMLMNLQPTTDKQIALFSDLGLYTEEAGSAFYDAEGKMKPLNEIAGLLNDSMAGLTDAQRSQALETMFGTDALRVANILFREGAEGVDTMNAAMNNTTAADVAATRLNNLKGAAEALKGSLETVAIQLYSSMQEPLKKVVDALNDTVNEMADSGMLDALGETLGSLASTLGETLIAILPPIVELINALLPPLLEIIDAVLPVIVDLLNTLLPIISAEAEVFGQWIGELLPPLIDFIGQLIEPIGEIAEALMPAWKEIMDALFPVIQTLMDSALGPLIDIFLAIIEPLSELLSAILPPLIEVFAAFSPILVTVAEAISPILELVGTLIGLFMDSLMPAVTGVSTILLDVLAGAFDAIAPYIETLMSLLGDLIDFIVAVFTGDWEGAWEAIGNIVVDIMHLIPQAMETMVNAAIAILNGLIDAMNWALDAIGLATIGHVGNVDFTPWNNSTASNGAPVTGRSGGTSARVDAAGKAAGKPGFGGAKAYATGLDYVPFDRFPAYLDKAERVLTADEAIDYRRYEAMGIAIAGGYVGSGDAAAQTINLTAEGAVSVDGRVLARIVFENFDDASAFALGRN